MKRKTNDMNKLKDDLKALFYCLKKEGVIEEHEKCEKQCSYCKMEKSLGQ